MKNLLIILSCLFLFACTNQPAKEESKLSFAKIFTQSGSDTTIVTVGDSAVVFVRKIVMVNKTDTLYHTYKVPDETTSHYKIAINSPAPQNRPPVANAGSDLEITLPTNSFTRTGTGSDPDGDAITYQWTSNGTVVSNSASFTASNLAAGTFIYTLKVTDDKGNFTTDNVTVTVKPAIVVDPPPTGGVTQTLSFTQTTSDFSRPESGAEIWYNGFQVGISNVSASDRYIRFNWSGLNPGNGQYNWTVFDQEINKAIDAKQGFSFGMMTQYYGGGGSVGIANYYGANSSYPQWLHTQMNAESVKPFKNGGDWVPNWNSPSYLSAYEKFCVALNSHLQTTTYKNVLYKNVIVAIDIRGYGNFGEWHAWPYGDGPSSATKATTATLKRIVDAHKNAFNDFRLVAMISGMGDSWSAANTEVSHYLLTQTTKAGPFGIRRDNWGATESYYNQDIWQNNSRTYNGVALKTLIMEKYKTAPITGEPCCNSGYTALPAQVALYHVNSFGNGNYGNVNNSSIVTASKAAGARITMTGGSVTTNKGSLSVSVNWNNTGVAAIYRDWNVVFKLKNGNTVVESLASTFNPKLFLPGARTSTDTFTGLTAGTYTLTIEMVDPSGYRTPYPIGVNGRNSDGSYNLKTVTIQ